MHHVIVPALFIQTIGAYLYFIAFANSTLAPMIYGGTKFLLFVLPLVLLLLGFRFGPFLPTANILPATIKGILFGLTGGLAMWGITAGFVDYFVSLTPHIFDALVSLNIQGHFIAFAIFLSLIHSLFEEYYWRWFVFGGLKVTLPIGKAAIMSSAAFSAHHLIVMSRFFPLWLNLIFGLAIFAGGLFWCWLYERYRNLWGNWISHAILDGVIMTIAYQLMAVYTNNIR